MVFLAKYKRALLLVASLFMAGVCLDACIVRGLTIAALPCGYNGECSEGRRCFALPSVGPRCLLASEEYPLYSPDGGVTDAPGVADSVSDAKPPETKVEAKPEAKPEPQPEPKPEPKPEPTPEPKAEPKPEPTPEPTTEPVSDAGVADTQKETK